MDAEDCLARLLPHRLDALAIAALLLRFRLKWEEPKPMQILVEGRLPFDGRTTMFTNPALEIGVLHARALLEFIRLKVKSGVLAQLDPSSRLASASQPGHGRLGDHSRRMVSPAAQLQR